MLTVASKKYLLMLLNLIHVPDKILLREDTCRSVNRVGKKIVIIRETLEMASSNEEVKNFYGLRVEITTGSLGMVVMGLYIGFKVGFDGKKMSPSDQLHTVARKGY